MNFTNLLDLNLKSDEIVELLDAFDLEVIYDFDRLHENTPDSYSVSAKAAGFEFIFDEQQVLTTIFLYVLPRSDFQVIDGASTGVPFYSSFSEAERAFVKHGTPFTTGKPGYRWIKGEFVDHTVHYEFNTQDQLSLVTLNAK